MLIAEAAVFCSTIVIPGGRLDLQSEAYDELPYDRAALAGLRPFPALKPIRAFAALLQRKLYTCNCISACIAYLGSSKGYQGYADAARDPEIVAVIRRIVPALNAALVRQFKVRPAEQTAFAAAALRKFQDRDIADDIARNARHVLRKLAPGDRLLAPARLIRETGGNTDALALTIAAALLYRGPDEIELARILEREGAAKVFGRISELGAGDRLVRRVAGYFRRLQAGQSFGQILKTRGKLPPLRSRRRIRG